MTANNPAAKAIAWLISRLSGQTSAGTRIYSGVAPDSAALPYIIIDTLPGADVRGVGTATIMTTCYATVLGLSLSSIEADTLSAAIHTQLHGQQSEADGVIGCVRNQSLFYHEAFDGQIYTRAGGVYQIYVQ